MSVCLNFKVINQIIQYLFFQTRVELVRNNYLLIYKIIWVIKMLRSFETINNEKLNLLSIKLNIPNILEFLQIINKTIFR